MTGKRVWETSESEPKSAEEELRQSFEELQRTFEGTIAALGVIVEKRDPYIVGHHQRVTRLACAIAEEIGLAEERTEGIRVAGLIHDIGKFCGLVWNQSVQVNRYLRNRVITLSFVEWR